MMQARTWTISGLAVEFGIDRRTVAKRLESLEPDDADGKSKRWLMKRAAPRLIAPMATGDGDEALDPIAERARKDKEHADKLALENAARRRELVEVGDVAALWAKLAAETRARVLGVPTKAAPLVIGCSRIAEAQDILETQIHDALGAIADPGPGVPGRDEAAAETDDQRVGGPVPATEPGGERRAG